MKEESSSKVHFLPCVSAGGGWKDGQRSASGRHQAQQG
jgi:hypothetical protein